MILIIFVLVAINRTFVTFTREALVQEQVEKMNIEASNIKIAIQLSRKGEQYVLDLMGQNLRSVALYAQAVLDPDIEKVKNEDIAAVSKKAMVDHITLMKRAGDDIIGYKSDDPKEIGMSTKGWRGYWFQAFNELLDHKNTTVPVGQKLPNYWAGPLNTSMTNPDNVDLWGYYYDGTTNYIIDPYVHDTTFRSYQKETGVDAIIQAFVAENQIAEEVTVFNPPTFLKEQEQFKKDGVVWYSDREILFGTHNLKADEDVQKVKEAYKTKKEVTLETVINGKPMLKTYTPLDLEFPVVIGITSDMTQIHEYLQEFTNRMYFVSVLSSLVALIILFLIIRYYNRNKEEAVQSVQDVFVGNIDQLFTSIKEQRHDFNNHIATIQSLVAAGQYDELKKYTNEIVGETAIINDIININSPALSALIQAKITQAFDRKIKFEHHIINMDKIPLNAVKSTDLVKIVSNLIDNAFEAVEKLEESERYVLLEGYREGDKICFSVYNKGVPIPVAQVDKIFEKGYSTKKDTGKNSGLGLYIVQKIIKQYNGRVTVDPKEDGNTFKVALPL
jgi:anti-sigma regulatory factor (Ser/Thr protein kinase)